MSDLVAQLAALQEDIGYFRGLVEKLLDERAQVFGKLRAEGWTYARIADAAGMTDAAVVKAVEKRGGPR